MTGWVRFQLPEALRRAAPWRVRVCGAVGLPGDLLAAAAGEQCVSIEAELALPPAQAVARLEVTVSVVCGRVTDIRLPLPLLKAAAEQ